MTDVEEQDLISIEAGQTKIYLWPRWLTRRFVLLWLLSILTFGPILTALLFTAGDQWLRNQVDDWMSDPDLYTSLSIGPDEYQSLPVHWRQVLAEAAVRDPNKATILQELVKTLTVEHIKLLERLAPYVVSNSNSSFIFRHQVQGVALVDYITLENLGVLYAVDSGFWHNFGHNTFISGIGTALVTQLDNPDQKPNLRYIALTVVGKELMRLLRRPTDLGYLERIARELERIANGNARVELWAIGTHDMPSTIRLELGDVGRIDRSTVIVGPPEEKAVPP